MYSFTQLKVSETNTKFVSNLVAPVGNMAAVTLKLNSGIWGFKTVPLHLSELHFYMHQLLTVLAGNSPEVQSPPNVSLTCPSAALSVVTDKHLMGSVHPYVSQLHWENVMHFPVHFYRLNVATLGCC